MTKSKKLIIFLASFLICSLCAFGAFAVNALSLSDKNSGKINYKIEPEITVDMPSGFTEELPNAVLNESYAIPSASAIDVYGDELSVKVDLYAHYYSENRSLIQIENNAFIPQFYGVYTLCYTATDCFDNVSSKIFDVVCQDKTPLTASLTDTVGSYYVGREVKVNDIIIENFIGETSVIITATCEKTSYSVKNGSFIPEYEGEYTIEYTFSDYNETGKVSYTLNVEKDLTPIFTSNISLPSYFIVGVPYSLPSVSCKVYRNNTCYDITPKISLRYLSSESSKIITNGEFTPTIEGDIVITYEASMSDYSAKREFYARVVDVNFTSEMDMAKYFQGTDVGVKTLSYGVMISTLTDGASFDFINSVLSRKLSMNLGIDVDKNSFTSLDIYLTDFNNKDMQVKLSYVKGDSSAEFAVNDEDFYATSYGFNNATSLSFEYDNKTHSANMGGSDNVVISKTLSGEQFNGFESEFITVKFVLKGVTGYSTVYVYSIDNQTFSNDPGDGARPYIVFSPYSKGEGSLGDVIEIDRIYVVDILDPNYTVNYYVLTPSGDYVTSVGGEVLDIDTDYTKEHSFIATENGRYDVYMVISDSVGNSETFAYSIYIMNKQGPVFDIPTDNIIVKAGNTVKLHKAKVKDNLTPSDQISIYVVIVCPDWTTEIVDNGATYNPNQYGVYTVNYYAWDSDGNISIASYTFTVQ